jgi:protein TonB
MAYQALLFCPDEKTARTVTQVLSELDFAVIPCTEPFGAVKKLMAEHFDAVVVDCDNEQNATLLFKSARNTTGNASSLAVAVVEGQAGVAKAFRIGANLVLTKPINVEQAKGTLRVARGLLRKNEAAKSVTGAANPAVKPVAPAPAVPKAVPQNPISTLPTARPAMPAAPSAAAAKPSTLISKPAQRPTVVASVPAKSADAEPLPSHEASEDIAEPVLAEPVAQTSAPKISSGVASPVESEPRVTAAASQPVSAARAGSGAASAPAPAREKEASVLAESKPSSTIAEPEGSVAEVAEVSGNSAVQEVSPPSTSFTFGGNVSSGGGNKKVLLGVLAVLLLAAIGYEVWMQWQLSEGYTTPPAHVATQPVKTPVTAPKVAPSVAPVAAPASAPNPATSPAPDAVAVPQPSETTENSSDSDTQTKPVEEKPKVSPNKVKASPEKSEVKPMPSASASKTTAKKEPATTAVAPAPIMIRKSASQAVAKSTDISDAPAPSMAGIAPAGSSASLPNLMAGQTQAPAPMLQTMHVSQGVSQGLLVKRTPPSYPASAMQMHIEGSVELQATISKSGNISAVKIISGDPQLAHAAADAVKQWKYKPYLLNGEPVEIQTQVTVKFKLPN